MLPDLHTRVAAFVAAVLAFATIAASQPLPAAFNSQPAAFQAAPPAQAEQPGDCTPRYEPSPTPTPVGTPRPKRPTIGSNRDDFALAEAAALPYGPSAFQANGSFRPDAAAPSLAPQPSGQFPATTASGTPYPVPSRVVPLASTQQPKRVVLQAGHWLASALPDELKDLRDNSGAYAAGRSEWQINLDVARRTAALLTQRGYQVQIVPATVPIDCQADLFVALHADGSESAATSGFKIARPRYIDNAENRRLLADLYIEYGSATRLGRSDNLTRNMSGYYAFYTRRVRHAVNPRVPMAIVEMGYMTSPNDRRLLYNNPDVAAYGLANGIDRFLRGK